MHALQMSVSAREDSVKIKGHSLRKCRNKDIFGALGSLDEGFMNSFL